jgi:dihydrofolate reductase
MIYPSSVVLSFRVEVVMRVVGRGWLAMMLGLALVGLGCREVVEVPSALAYSINPAVYALGTVITPNNPTHSGGAIDAYSVSPALPGGLDLDAKSGVISGTPTVAAAAASYTVTGTNSAGSTTVSLTITVTGSSLTITTQPASQTVVVGQAATFTVTAAGTGTLTYQWLKNGLDLSTATSASYSAPAAALSDSGSTFSVKVADAFGGSLTSLDATLTVTTATASGTFSGTGRMSTVRVNHTATLLDNGKVLIVGGSNVGSSLISAELYDPATGGFSVTGSLQTARQNHTATKLSNGKVLIAGGTIGTGTSTTILSTAELYDPATATFALTAGNMTAGRADHTATLLPSGKVLMACGQSSGGYLLSAELYDPNVDTFSATTQTPSDTRALHTATLLTTGKVLLVGGYTGSAKSTAELYDPQANTFTPTGGLLVARSEHTAISLPSGKVLVVGGADSLTAELYDPAAGTFSLTGIPKAVRQRGLAAVMLSTGKVLITGGVGSGSTPPLLASAELYDPATGAFTLTGNLTVAREYHVATALPGAKALVVGGSSGSYLASAEIYY